VIALQIAHIAADMAPTFGDEIRGMRGRLRLTQEKLGERCFLHRNTIIAIENGDVVPDDATLVLLARGLETSYEALKAWEPGAQIPQGDWKAPPGTIPLPPDLMEAASAAAKQAKRDVGSWAVEQLWRAINQATRKSPGLTQRSAAYRPPDKSGGR